MDRRAAEEGAGKGRREERRGAGVVQRPGSAAARRRPDFVKALPIDHALDGEVMLAWQMNGAELPFLNGYPLRLVVPGYFGTYWIKHVSDIQVLTKPFDGFWMTTRLSHSRQPVRLRRAGHRTRGDRPDRPLQRPLLHHQPAEGRRCRPAARRSCAGSPSTAAGHLGGCLLGERRQDVAARELGANHGRYSFHEWTAPFRRVAGSRTTSRCAHDHPRRRDPAGRSALEPRRLHAQRDRNRPG